MNHQCDIESRQAKLIVAGENPPGEFGVYRPASLKEHGLVQTSWKLLNFQPQIPPEPHM
jgi:hypothetical protein